MSYRLMSRRKSTVAAVPKPTSPSPGSPAPPGGSIPSALQAPDHVLMRPKERTVEGLNEYLAEARESLAVLSRSRKATKKDLEEAAHRVKVLELKLARLQRQTASSNLPPLPPPTATAAPGSASLPPLSELEAAHHRRGSSADLASGSAADRRLSVSSFESASSSASLDSQAFSLDAPSPSSRGLSSLRRSLSQSSMSGLEAGSAEAALAGTAEWLPAEVTGADFTSLVALLAQPHPALMDALDGWARSLAATATATPPDDEAPSATDAGPAAAALREFSHWLGNFGLHIRSASPADALLEQDAQAVTQPALDADLLFSVGYLVQSSGFVAVPGMGGLPVGDAAGDLADAPAADPTAPWAAIVQAALDAGAAAVPPPGVDPLDAAGLARFQTFLADVVQPADSPGPADSDSAEADAAAAAAAAAAADADADGAAEPPARLVQPPSVAELASHLWFFIHQSRAALPHPGSADVPGAERLVDLDGLAGLLAAWCTEIAHQRLCVERSLHSLRETFAEALPDEAADAPAFDLLRAFVAAQTAALAEAPRSDEDDHTPAPAQSALVRMLSSLTEEICLLLKLALRVSRLALLFTHRAQNALDEPDEPHLLRSISHTLADVYAQRRRFVMIIGTVLLYAFPSTQDSPASGPRPLTSGGLLRLLDLARASVHACSRRVTRLAGLLLARDDLAALLQPAALDTDRDLGLLGAGGSPGGGFPTKPWATSQSSLSSLSSVSSMSSIGSTAGGPGASSVAGSFALSSAEIAGGNAGHLGAGPTSPTDSLPGTRPASDASLGDLDLGIPGIGGGGPAGGRRSWGTLPRNQKIDRFFGEAGAHSTARAAAAPSADESLATALALSSSFSGSLSDLSSIAPAGGDPFAPLLADLPGDPSIIFNLEGAVRAATIDRILDRLTHHSWTDPAFTDMVILTHQYFLTTPQFFAKLLERFFEQPKEGISEAARDYYLRFKIVPSRYRVGQVFLRWAELFPEHFSIRPHPDTDPRAGEVAPLERELRKIAAAAARAAAPGGPGDDPSDLPEAPAAGPDPAAGTSEAAAAAGAAAGAPAPAAKGPAPVRLGGPTASPLLASIASAAAAAAVAGGHHSALSPVSPTAPDAGGAGQRTGARPAGPPPPPPPGGSGPGPGLAAGAPGGGDADSAAAGTPLPPPPPPPLPIGDQTDDRILYNSAHAEEEAFNPLAFQLVDFMSGHLASMMPRECARLNAIATGAVRPLEPSFTDELFAEQRHHNSRVPRASAPSKTFTRRYTTISLAMAMSGIGIQISSSRSGSGMTTSSLTGGEPAGAGGGPGSGGATPAAATAVATAAATAADDISVVSGGQVLHLLPTTSQAIINILSANVSVAEALLNLDPSEVARQLCLLDFALLRVIRPRDFRLHVREKRPAEAGSITQAIRHATGLTCMVLHSVLEPGIEPKVRSELIRFWIEVLIKLRSYRNFNAMMAIIGALNSSSIHRLKNVWKNVSRRDTQALEDIRDLLSCRRNFSDYRAALNAAELPALPFLGVYLTDLTFIDEGNRDFTINTAPATGATLPAGVEPGATLHLVNVDKLTKISTVLQSFTRFQVVSYSFEPIRDLQSFFKNTEAYEHSDEHFYQLSLRAEGRDE
ncbi:hypothetical protein H696_01332 [Fonticula alba]|uniref:Ras-GEF domain-containing protein n=1 Tax=Fonticula alba TaxID=691883 RepID=A0A058ZEP3_FONAL|nr:hypothetical protein H696_01332 [Fonticula alba]KCV71922.1 hypothetical protein H696_01332 [Fonticula alba]|eukprot:XP_009493500.1 hypothetical protein H696_01332 [Fonticula alba]